MTDFAARVADLYQRDPELRAFGAAAHGYRFRPPVDELPDVPLPDDYRHFITRVGNGGAGPGYGMLPFNYLPGDHPLGYAWNPNLNSPFESADVKAQGGYDSERWIAGTVALADFGCGLTWYLVVTGDERLVGKVCADQRALGRGTQPYFGSFTEWYAFWLDTLLLPVHMQCPMGHQSCEMFRSIDSFIDQFKPQNPQQERAAFLQIPDGAMATRFAWSDRNFNQGDVLRLCHCCHSFVDWLVGRGVLPQAKLATGLPHKLER